MELVPGGFRQADDKKTVGQHKDVIAQCEAMSYHTNIYPLTGRVKFEKDSRHANRNDESAYAIDIHEVEKKNAIPQFDENQ